MRKRDLVQPNFVATVRFVARNEDIDLLLYGVDAAALTARLRQRYPGIQVIAVAPYDFAIGWGKKAADRLAEIEAAMATHQKYDFNKNSIWGELKDFLFDLFDGTCAYCECDLLDGSYGAVEHYRPKNPVIGVSGHPGYYWLAYDLSNYLPTCTRCNTSKSNAFPLAAGSPRAAAPGAEANEQPLLLNPYHLGKPLAEHLRFVSATADKVGPVARGVSDAGKASIDLLDLNRADLVPQRLHEQEKAASEYLVQRASGLNPPPVLQQLTAGTRPFSAAALAAVSFVGEGFPSLGG